MEYIDPFRIYGGVSGEKVVFNPPPNQIKGIVKFNTNYVPRLAQEEPLFSIPAQNAGRHSLVESIPEVFLPELVSGLKQTTFFTDVQQTPWYINSCIVNMIRKGDLDRLKLSVKKGLQIDRIIRGGKSLLTIAVLTQKPQMITWLLSKGANPNIVDDRGYTCLEYATSFNSAEILKTLFLCKNIPTITKRRACLLIKHANSIPSSHGNQKPQHVEVIKSLTHDSLGLSAEEYKRFAYNLGNKNVY